MPGQFPRIWLGYAQPAPQLAVRLPTPASGTDKNRRERLRTDIDEGAQRFFCPSGLMPPTGNRSSAAAGSAISTFFTPAAWASAFKSRLPTTGTTATSNSPFLAAGQQGLEHLRRVEPKFSAASRP
jgi:hypothetical protein